jgi:putative ATP-dependent endonuclease of the OLD family
VFLREIEINNFRSLEHVHLTGLGNFNVLIGRNNAGKSAIISALEMQAGVLKGSGLPGDRALTDQDASRSITIRLSFEPRTKDRIEFISLIAAQASPSFDREEVIDSGFFRKVEYTFRCPPGNPSNLHLMETSITGIDGKTANIQRIIQQEYENSPVARFTRFLQINDPLTSTRIDLANGPTIEANLPPSSILTLRFDTDMASTYPYRRLARFLGESFFFNPFRNSAEQSSNVEGSMLEPTGANLAQVLHTALGNDRQAFDKIEAFVKSALPDIGQLQSPLRGSSTTVGFRQKPAGFLIPLRDMGAGVEQLLMVATVLFTTTAEHTLFLEEPETHLHPGAQRFLIDMLAGNDRQIFLTTHSPTIVNTSKPRVMYQASLNAGRTAVTRLDAVALEDMLQEIGARNSDLFLSDAVLFVEGPSDGAILETWSQTLGQSFARNNITLLSMEGGQDAARRAPIRSQVLEGISTRAPVPHLFLLDHDERGTTEIDRLAKALPGLLHIFDAREIENYLLVPAALRQAIGERLVQRNASTEDLEHFSNAQLDQLIDSSAEALYDLILIKRIRAELGGLVGGWIAREETAQLASLVKEPRLATILNKHIRERVRTQLSELEVAKVIGVERRRLQAEWRDVQRRRFLAPGEEIISSVFQRFGLTYRKTKDGERIAGHMAAGQIHPEIRELISRVNALNKSRDAAP